jgi:hypothetical protein
MYSNQSHVQTRGIDFNAERGGGAIAAWQPFAVVRGRWQRTREFRSGWANWCLACRWPQVGRWCRVAGACRNDARWQGACRDLRDECDATSRRLLGGGEIALGVYNVGDRKYLDPASSAFTQDALVQDGRQFRLRWSMPL